MQAITVLPILTPLRMLFGYRAWTFLDKKRTSMHIMDVLSIVLGGWCEQAVSRILCPLQLSPEGVAGIYLGRRLLAASCNQPEG